MNATSPNPIGQLRRRTLIDMALRRQQPGSGSSRQRLEVTRMHWPDLREVLDGLAWAVVGAVATRLYMPERTTRDLDILIRTQDAEAVAARLQQAGFSRAGRLAIGGATWLAPDATPVDVIEVEEDWATDALVEALANRDAQHFPTLPLPYLVLMKLQASRVQDLADVSRMLGAAGGPVLNTVRSVVRRYAPELAEDLESLIYLGKLELGP